MIYYIFEKSTGLYMGSGTPYYDTEELGCTTTAIPSEFNYVFNFDYDSSQERKFPFWENDAWVLKSVQWGDGKWVAIENTNNSPDNTGI